tara:strand:- start:13470 stop:13769 length:300 start_codon:yes stop_codon:yes gene_type:complete
MKNAITVIDQELIDKFTLMVSVKEDHEIVSVTAGELFELIDMAKDLIEINAELTKREQKYKGSLSMIMNEIESKEFCHSITVTDAYCLAVDLLKGDSDE